MYSYYLHLFLFYLPVFFSSDVNTNERELRTSVVEWLNYLKPTSPQMVILIRITTYIRPILTIMTL